ncbi:hypothetical protein ES708_34764 [subsurface metagenome]
MKKLLIVLMVVAMASFLLVGCLGTTPPIDPEDPVEPDEPGLYLFGIEVDPKTMDLIVGETKDIKSVTATYVVRAYEDSIILEDCLFLTSDSKVATVKKDVDDVDKVTVTAIAEGTADIIVSYKGEIDVLEVTVAYKSMEIKVDTPILLTTSYVIDAFAGNPEAFTIEIVANSDVGKMVLPYLILPEGLALEEEDGKIELLIHIWVGREAAGAVNGWLRLYVNEDDSITGFPPDLLEDSTEIYQITINEPGNYSAKLEYKTFPGGVTLGSKVITAVVTPAPTTP